MYDDERHACRVWVRLLCTCAGLLAWSGAVLVCCLGFIYSIVHRPSQKEQTGCHYRLAWSFLPCGVALTLVAGFATGHLLWYHFRRATVRALARVAWAVATIGVAWAAAVLVLIAADDCWSAWTDERKLDVLIVGGCLVAVQAGFAVTVALAPLPDSPVEPINGNQ